MCCSNLGVGLKIRQYVTHTGNKDRVCVAPMYHVLAEQTSRRLLFPLPRQNGFVLLGLLLVLIAGGVAFAETDRASRLEAESASRYLGAFELFQILHESKVALLGYALSYADNYSPGGAGPGHFPCPDHDSPDDGNPRNDGPDPPCARQQQTVGRLPRMTTTGRTGSRHQPLKVLEFYPLESMLDRQPWYAVSAALINNPGNRVVNPATESRLLVDTRANVLALVVEPGSEFSGAAQQRPGVDVNDYLEGDNAQLGLQYRRAYADDSNDLLLPIYASELLPLLNQRVMGFVVDWLKDTALRNCPDLVFSHQAVVQGQQPGIVGVAQGAGVGCFPSAAEFGQLECQADLFEGGLPLADGNCVNSIATHNSLDGISLNRHWFVRNKWFEHIRYSIRESCRHSSAQACDIVISESPDQLHVEIMARPAAGNES